MPEMVFSKSLNTSADSTLQSKLRLALLAFTYTAPKATDDFIANNEKKKHSSYGMKSCIP
jgi:hypothetical protein